MARKKSSKKAVETVTPEVKSEETSPEGDTTAEVGSEETLPEGDTTAEVGSEEVGPAIVEEPTIKVMQKGKGVRYMTQSEYDAEFAK